MIVNIQLKHLVIPLIVFGITFCSLLYYIENDKNNTEFDILFLYENSDLIKRDMEYKINESLYELEQNYELNEGYNQITTRNINIENNTQSQIIDSIRKSDLVIIYGDIVEEDFEEIIIDHDDTYFVIINNSYEYNLANVINISIDKEEIIMESAQSLALNTQTNKIGYIGLDYEENEEEYLTFEEEVKKVDEEIEVYYLEVTNIDNKLEVENLILDAVEIGIDSFFVSDPKLNEVVVRTAKNAQQLIDEKIEEEEIEEEEIEEDEELVQVEKINVITTTTNTYFIGIYEDTNENGKFDIGDNSVVLESYIVLIYPILENVLGQIMDNTFASGSYEIFLESDYIKTIDEFNKKLEEVENMEENDEYK